MKILKLRFENLNSLNGKWEIDFTHPEYISNGIFAIIGPTGAGKSTILDAICLALYGRTPRLNKISASTNEIMSRQTGECYAELEFQTKKDQYRINWGQKRARGKSDGVLQGSKHILYDNNGVALEDKKRELAEKVTEITGMDFDRFTRSMLLAQGGFAAFLQATPDERAPILEEITGSEIYTEISMMVHETNREKQQVLEVVKAEVKGIELLPDEEEKTLQSEVKSNEKVETELKKKDKSTKDKINWVKNIDNLRKELTILNEESKEVNEELKAFKPKRDIVAKALKAVKIDSEYTLLKEKRNSLVLNLKAYDIDIKLLPEVLEKLKESEKLYKDKSDELTHAKKVESEELELLKKVRALDIQIAEKVKLQEDINEKKEKFSKDIRVGQVKIDNFKAKGKTVESNKKDSDAYIKNNPKDEQLNVSLEGIKERLNNINLSERQLKDLQGKIKRLKAEITLKSKKNEKEEINKKEAEKEYSNITAEVEIKKEELKNLLNGRLLREFRDKKDVKLKEHIYVSKIADLEFERKQLEDDKACPLCGSIHHPFAVGNIPELTTLEKEIEKLNRIIKEAEKIESDMVLAEKSANLAKEKIAEVIGKIKLLSQSIEDLNKSLLQVEDDANKISAEFADMSRNLSAEIDKFGYSKNSLDNRELLVNQLSKRLQLWEKNKKLQNEFVNQLNQINIDILKETALLKQLNSHLEQYNKESATAFKNLSLLQAERKELYGNKEPDIEERKCAVIVANAEKNANSAKSAVEQLTLKVKELQTKIQQLSDDIKRVEPVINKLEKEFIDHCLNLGFENEEVFLAARMARDELELLANVADNLDKKSANIATREGEVKQKLKAEDAKKMTEEPLNELTKQQVDIEDSLGKLREKIGGIREKLKNNNESREKIKNSEIEIKKAEKEVSKWSTLHSLIGSADGKKFRNFAQGLTFQIMVSYANKQLSTMSDRYLLVRDKNSPLDLNVIDNYQAGEERSTKNLSGGESFIISLALALGLSHMASRNVSIDSLFLDEGFGTLDEDSLEMALESLSTLQQKNKLIGIISHVGALKERITTQINVTPTTGGKSELSGPGCFGNDEL